jgi:hypothetical protein
VVALLDPEPAAAVPARAGGCTGRVVWE